MHCRAAFVGVICLGMWFHAFAREPYKRPTLTEDQLNQVEEALNEILTGRVHLIVDATVVDEQGKPVPKFSVEHQRPLTDADYNKLQSERGLAVRMQERFPELARKKWIETQEKFRGLKDTSEGNDGVFRSDGTNLVGFDLEFLFSAPGQYPAEIRVEDPGNNNDEPVEALDKTIVQSVISRAPLPKEILVKESFKVVMRKKGAPTELERFSVDLEANRKGERIGFQFASPSGKEKAGKVSVDPKAKALPPRLILLALKRDGTGKFLTEKVSSSSEVPIDAKIVMNASPGEGFVRYTPRRPGTGNPRVHYGKEPVRRGMVTAPETGYSLEIALSAEDLASDKPVWFYFKCAGRYGRAEIAYPTGLERDGSRFYLRLKVELQTDGSRNLETGE